MLYRRTETLFSDKGKNLNRLAKYAMKLGVIDKLTPYLEVLV